MKKIVTGSILMLCISSGLFAQKSFNKFIRKYKKIENAEYKHAGRIPMIFIHMVVGFTKADDIEERQEKTFLKEMLAFKVLNFSTNSKQLEAKVELKKVKFDLLNNKYKMLMFVNTKGNNVNILAKTQGDNIIKDCVVLIDRDKDFSAIRIKGKINLDMIKNLSDEWNDGEGKLAKD